MVSICLVAGAWVAGLLPSSPFLTMFLLGWNLLLGAWVGAESSSGAAVVFLKLILTIFTIRDNENAFDTDIKYLLVR